MTHKEREIELQRIRILLEITKGKKDRKSLEERTALYRKLAALGCDTRELSGEKYEVPERKA